MKDKAYQFAADAWKFYQDHRDGDNTMEYWQGAIDAADLLYRKYSDSRMARKIILAIITGLEDEAKKEGSL